jgi:hypothetical protein
MEYAINSGSATAMRLGDRLRQLITDAILSVSDPKLDYHVAFFEGLRKRTFNRPCCVYIITTNYDTLFEMAGASAGVTVETGFSGSVERFFDQQRFTTSCGIINNGNRFEEHPLLTVRLIKLHGSVSWFMRNEKFFESHPKSISGTENRVLILPRRRKILDTLLPPYDLNDPLIPAERTRR